MVTGIPPGYVCWCRTRRELSFLPRQFGPTRECNEGQQIVLGGIEVLGRPGELGLQCVEDV
ncbi:hypothetical protein ACWDWS_33930, partial [Streptomyces sp. NPDC003328]